MNAVVLQRDMDWEEREAVRQNFPILHQRASVRPRSVVVPRYSALPGYAELFNDLRILGSTAVSTPDQFAVSAHLTQWFPLIEDLCLPAWWDVGSATVPDSEHGYVVKGETNSLKRLWSTHMFARSRDELSGVMSRVMDDTLVGTQKLIIRPFIPLEVVEEGINGVQATNEWRFMFMNGIGIGQGYYWSWVENPPTATPPEALALAKRAAARLPCPFVCIDVAKTLSGEWKVVEVNAGEQAGLSLIDPFEFYNNMAIVLRS